MSKGHTSLESLEEEKTSEDPRNQTGGKKKKEKSKRRLFPVSVIPNAVNPFTKKESSNPQTNSDSDGLQNSQGVEEKQKKKGLLFTAKNVPRAQSLAEKEGKKKSNNR